MAVGCLVGHGADTDHRLTVRRDAAFSRDDFDLLGLPSRGSPTARRGGRVIVGHPAPEGYAGILLFTPVTLFSPESPKRRSDHVRQVAYK